MKRVKRILAMLITLVLLMSGIPTAMAHPGTPPPPPLTTAKTATLVAGTTNRWTINLTVVANKKIYDAEVYDAMGDKFNVVSGSISVTKGGTSLGTDIWGNTYIYWNIDDLGAGSSAELTYQVTINDTAKSNKNYKTNEYATIYFSDEEYYWCKDQKDFPVPEINTGWGSIMVYGYEVNAAGQPIDASGNVTTIASAKKITSSAFQSEGSSNLKFPASYTISAPTATGYFRPSGAPATQMVNLAISNKNTPVYFPLQRQMGTVLVNYIEEGTSNNLDTATLTGGVGDSYTVDTTRTFTGFTYHNVVNPNGSNVYKATNSDITVNYTRNSYNYTVHYFKNGVEDTSLAYTLSAPFEAPVSHEDKTITGYHFDSTTGPINIGTGTNVINVYYVKDAKSVTVKYVEKDDITNVLDTDTLDGFYSDSYTVDTSKTFGGFTYDSVEDPNGGVYGVQNGIVYVYYTRDPASVLVKYVEKGNLDNVLGTDTLSGLYGDPYTVNTGKTFKGFTFDSVEDPNEGILDVENGIITVLYTRNSYDYTVRYYKDGVEDTTLAYTNSALFGSSVTAVTDKKPAGYSQDRIEGLPLIIGTEGNTVKVYYTKDTVIDDGNTPLDSGTKIDDQPIPKTMDSGSWLYSGAFVVLTVTGSLSTLVLRKKRKNDNEQD